MRTPETYMSTHFPEARRADSPYAPCGRMAIVSSVARYRRFARELARRDDTVLEIGCSTGETTRVLAKSGARVFAVDIAGGCVERTAAATEGWPEVTVRRLDARNVQALAEIAGDPTLVFIDIGGNALLDAVAYIVRLCLKSFSPRVMVVRSAELAALCSLADIVEPSALAPLRRVSPRQRGRFVLQCLLDQSRSTKPDNRIYAIYRLFALATPAARRRIEEMAGDPHARVQRIARRSLEQWGLRISDFGLKSEEP